jgi:hypothetical protein
MNEIWRVRHELRLVLTGWHPEGYLQELAARYTALGENHKLGLPG